MSRCVARVIRVVTLYYTRARVLTHAKLAVSSQKLPFSTFLSASLLLKERKPEFCHTLIAENCHFSSSKDMTSEGTTWHPPPLFNPWFSRHHSLAWAGGVTSGHTHTNSHLHAVRLLAYIRPVVYSTVHEGQLVR